MKKKRLLSSVILALMIGVFLVPNGEEAATQCKYVWKNTIIAPKKDSNGKAVATEHTFVLSTEGDSKRLTQATSPFESTRPAKFANSKGIALKSDGSCPTISIYMQSVAGGFKIYSSNSNCKSGALTTDKNCSKNLSGTKLNGTTSDSDVANTGTQFELSSSTSNSCSYVRKVVSSTANENVKSARTININAKNNKKATGTCKQDIGLCSLKIKVPEKFYNDNTFYCPKFIYTSTDTTGKEGTNYKVTVYDVGKSEDTNKSTTDTEGNVVNPSPNKTYTDNSNLDNLNKEYNSCSQIIDMSEGKFGWILQKLLNYIKIAGPILVVLLSAVDFIKAMASSDENVFKKAQSRLMIRLIAALALFLVPTLVQLLLGLINGISDPTCGLK